MTRETTKKTTRETIKKMRIRNLTLGLLGTLSALAVFAATATAAEPAAAPAWNVTSLPTPTNFIPGDTSHDYTYDVRIADIGAAETDGSSVTITDILPEGLTAESVDLPLHSSIGHPFNFGPYLCNIASGPPAVVTCTLPETFPTGDELSVIFPSEEVRMVIHVDAPAGMAAMPLENHVTVEGGGAGTASTVSENATTDESNPQSAPAGFTYAKAQLTGLDGKEVTQAGARPYQYTTSFAVNTKFAPAGNVAPFVPAGGDVKDIPVELPPGLVGNPNAVQKCKAGEFSEFHRVDLATGGYFTANACPDSSAVGFVRLQQVDGSPGLLTAPLYNLAPPPGEPGQFGFQLLGLPFFIDTEVRPEDNYAITATARNLSQGKRVTAASVTIWGDPGADIHNPLRGSCLNEKPESAPLSLGNCASGIENRPFLRLPTSCETPMDILMAFDTWTDPGVFLPGSTALPPASGCDRLGFEPSLQARPTNDVADSPTGLQVDLHLPQNEDPEGLGTSDLRTTAVTLPEGLVINPSGANGLAACSPAEIGLKQPSPLRFDDAPATCPDASKIGKVEVDTPLVDHPLEGGVYVAKPHDNPFGSLLAIYLSVDDPISGVVVKLAGEVKPDPQTGRLRTVFTDTPQVPFEDFKLEFFKGSHGVLRTPAVCGNYATDSVMTPWSAPAGSPVTWRDNYSISGAPGGGSCPTTKASLPNSPQLDAGAASPLSGHFSPLVIHLRREDDSQEFSKLTLSPPPGLLARLVGVPYCPEAAIAAAAAKSGAAEQSSPSCPADSQVGTVHVAAGAGPSPYWTQGNAYLAGPYKGAPLSLAVITPAVAGPFDLGTVIVRVALQIDPETARVTAVSDPIPAILEGIPLDVRTISMSIDRPSFTLTGTSCDPLAFGGQLVSTLGNTAPLAERYQLADCGRLGFKPKLGLRLFGKTRRAAHPKLRAVLRMPAKGEANTARAVVALPHSEFLEQAHIRTICTRVQYAAHDCPRGSIYGYAKAWSPLLAEPLQGPVYLRSSSHPLPDLVASLDGQIHIDLVGKIDSVHGGIRTTFASVPDAPVSAFVLNMQGGRKGLLVNSTNVCRGKHRASAALTAQDGRAATLHPALRNGRCKHSRHGPRRRHHRG